jgi:hypothetical protein
MDQVKPRVLYGEANYRAIVEQNGYYVDKTRYIYLLERFRSPVFLRPRRFGKSLLCTTLQYYYDINQAADFDDLFGKTWVGSHPTPEQGKYFVLHFDFSVIDPSGSMESIREGFNFNINGVLDHFVALNRRHFSESYQVNKELDAWKSIRDLSLFMQKQGLPPFYLIIDEYDNFANQLIVDRKDQLYRELTGEDSFFKAFFKTIKECRKTGSVARVFITGVLPITIDDLASGYNIADFLTLDTDFDAMLGFNQAEVNHLLDRVYHDYELDPGSRAQVEDVIKSNYNGYHFSGSDGEALYNSTILIYFLEKLTRHGKIPEFLTDLNLKTDIRWVRRLTAFNPERIEELVDQLTIENQLPYSKTQLRDKFDMSQFFEKSFYPISFFYLGMLTRRDDYTMCIPNLNMKTIISEYFHEVHQVDVATRFAELMRSFAERPDLPDLFAGWWGIYISQLPEAVFAKVNENFYRTTFFDVCRQFLSQYYVWRMESSYATGRADLEMEGKYHTPFAGDRYLMEFKYLSNAKVREKNLDIDHFEPPEADWTQLQGYEREQRASYPEQHLRAYLIYCFGNKGFRIFLSES